MREKSWNLDRGLHICTVKLCVVQKIMGPRIMEVFIREFRPANHIIYKKKYTHHAEIVKEVINP